MPHVWHLVHDHSLLAPCLVHWWRHDAEGSSTGVRNLLLPTCSTRGRRNSAASSAIINRTEVEQPALQRQPSALAPAGATVVPGVPGLHVVQPNVEDFGAEAA